MFRIIDWIERICARIVYGPEDSDPVLMQTLDRAFTHEPLQEFHDYWRDREKKHHLEMELQNAEWILEYEKRLIRIQKETAAQRSKAEQAGTNTDRLRNLEHHLAGLRRSLD